MCYVTFGLCRSYRGNEAPGTILYTDVWTGPIKVPFALSCTSRSQLFDLSYSNTYVYVYMQVLFIETKGSTGLDYHQAVGHAVMHPAEVITRKHALAMVSTWPHHIIEEANDLLAAAKGRCFRAFPLTDKHLFSSPLKVHVPKATVDFSRKFTARVD